MINKKRRKQALYSAVATAGVWSCFINTALAEDGMSEKETGVFGGLVTTDILVGALIVVCIFLLLMSIVNYLVCRKSASKKKVDSLDEKIRRLETEQQSLRNEFEKSNNEFENKLEIIGAGLQAKGETARREMPPVDKNLRVGINPLMGRSMTAQHGSARQLALTLFLEEYNNLSRQNLSGFEDKKARTDFIAKYKIKAFSCVNYDERMRQPNLQPIFLDVQSPAGGKYWAVKLTGQDVYYVVPNPKGTYEAQLHTTGGMKEAFGSNYREGSYEHIEVVRAAEFMYLNGGWTISNPGAIRLS